MSQDSAELVRLTIVGSEAEAELVRGLLATEGIESMQRPTDVGAGALDGWAAGGSREILVRAADLENARELIAKQPPG
ncbi:MAG: putative signal transducing protein [Gaiellaceae bacterium]